MSYLAAQQHLAREPQFAALIEQIGPCELNVDNSLSPLQALVRSVCYQQLHTKAGDKIYARLLACFSADDYHASHVLSVSAEQLRQVGLSARKAATLHALAEAELSGLLPKRHNAKHFSEQELIARITQVKGIGPWTVQMWLMFHEGREDIWPVLDFGVREGWRRLYQLPEQPSARQLQSMADSLSPYRSIAAWYLWRVPKL